jgi:phenylalanyl-tRNA synthetase beta chain
MRVPLSWLREYVDVQLEPEVLAERLTLLGMEVKEVMRRGDDWRSVVVGELLEVTKHPSADKLSLTRVRVDEAGTTLAIVCGATNIAAGQRVPVALPGAVLPGDRRIEISRIAGAESQGMLCSGDELRLTSDAEGILILPDEAPVGRPLAELYADVVLDVDVKPNRGDALSLIGLAREVSAATGAPVHWPELAPEESGDATSEHVSVEVREPSLCPRFVARYVDGVRVAESPIAVQLRLTAAGMRPVSNVVDASNYVMLELGKPVHTFDAAAVAGGSLVVRLASPGERLETLDHVTRPLDAETLLVAGATGPLAIAGVIGGASSEVGEGTSALIIESAIFDPVSIRRTGQRYGLRSEASLRFEKGQEHRLARLGADRAARLIRAWGGGRVARGVVDTDPSEPMAMRVPFRPQRISRLLGVPIPADEQRALLTRVGIDTGPAAPSDSVTVITGEAPLVPDPGRDGEPLVAVVPSHRRDLAIEADVAEEVARVRGYETVPARRPDTLVPPYRPDPRAGVELLRDLLAGRGLSEVVSHALVAPFDHARLGPAAAEGETIVVANPVSADHSELRRSLLPGLLRVLATNERARRRDVAIFELGGVHGWRDGEPVQEERLGILLSGDWQRPGWDQPARQADVGDVKALLEWLAERLRLPELDYETSEARPGVDHPGRSASVRFRAGAAPAESHDPAPVGRVGELHPDLLAAYELRAERVAVADIELAPLIGEVGAPHRIVPPSRFPQIERDLAVVVAEDAPAGRVAERVRAAAGELLRDLQLFDRYQGPPLEPSEVSLAFRLRLGSPQRTLTDAEVDALMARVAGALTSELGARIRD